MKEKFEKHTILKNQGRNIWKVSTVGKLKSVTRNSFFTIILTVASFLTSIASFGQIDYDKEYFDLLRKADSLSKVNEIQLAIKYSEKALIKHESYNNLYNLALLNTLEGSTENAVYYLIRCLQKDKSFSERIISDKGFTKIVHNINLDSISEKLDNENIYKTDSVFMQEILNMHNSQREHRLKIDSIIRKYGDNSAQTDSLWTIIKKIDQKNLENLNVLIESKGFPTRTLVGERAARIAFMIVQHSEVENMKNLYPFYKKHCLSGELPISYLAYLTDRIMMNTTFNQLFGTQLKWNSEINNYSLIPIEDAINLHIRRKEFGLSNINSYLERYNITYD